MSDSESDGEAQFQRWLARKQGTEPARPRAYDDRAQKDATAAHRPEKKSPGSNCREGRTALDPAAVEYDSAAVCAGPGPAETGEERARGEEACGGCGNGLAGQEVREEFPGSETLEAERGSSLAAHVTEAGGGEFAGRSGAAEQREEVVLEVEILLETQRGDDEVPRVDAVVGNRPAAERRDGVAPQTAVVVPPVESPLEPPCGGEVPQGGMAGEVGSATPSEEELLVPATRITTAEREGGSPPSPAAEAGGSARFSVRSRVRAFMEKAATHTFLPTEATEPDGMAPSCCVSTADERSSALPLIDVASSLDDLERRAHEAMRPWLEDEDEASEFSMWRSRGGWAEELDEYSPHLPPLPPTPSAAEQSRLSNELNRSVDTLRSRLAAIQGAALPRHITRTELPHAPHPPTPPRLPCVSDVLPQNSILLPPVGPTPPPPSARLDMADVPVQLLPVPQAEDDEEAHVEEDKAAHVEEERQEARDHPVAVETTDPAMEQADGSVAVASPSGEAAEVVADRCSCRGCTGGFWACSRRLRVGEAGGGRADDGRGGGNGVHGDDERAEKDARVMGGDLRGAAARGRGDGNGGRGERDEHKLREEGKLREKGNVADEGHEEGVDHWGERGSGRGQHDGDAGERGEGGSTVCSENQRQRASGVEGARQVSEEEAETLVSQMKLLRQRWAAERGDADDHDESGRAGGGQRGDGAARRDSNGVSYSAKGERHGSEVDVNDSEEDGIEDGSGDDARGGGGGEVCGGGGRDCERRGEDGDRLGAAECHGEEDFARGAARGTAQAVNEGVEEGAIGEGLHAQVNRMPAEAGQQGGGVATGQDDREGSEEGRDESDGRDAAADGAPIGVLGLEGGSSAGGAINLEEGGRRVYSSPLERQLGLDEVDQHQEGAERGSTEGACGRAEASSTPHGEMNAIIGRAQEPLHELQLEPVPRVEHDLHVNNKMLAVTTKDPHQPTGACPQFSPPACAMVSSDDVPTDDENDDDTDPMIAMLKLRIRESKAKLAALKSL